MSADAEMVPVAWLLNCYGARTLTFVAPDAETLKTTDATPLYSADTIAALKRDAWNEAVEACAKECETPELACCGSPVVGAEYMGQQEMICCGCPESDEPSAAQCASRIRALRKVDAAIDAAQSTEGSQ